MRVRSAVDWWLTLIFMLLPVLLIAGIFSVPGVYRLIYIAIGLPILIFLGWIYFGTYYELREDHLYCRSGPFREKIKYDEIKSVKLSGKLYSSMALSSKRIEIRQHGKGFFAGTTYISPVDRESFYKELLSRCRNLEE